VHKEKIGGTRIGGWKNLKNIRKMCGRNFTGQRVGSTLPGVFAKNGGRNQTPGPAQGGQSRWGKQPENGF